MIRHPRDERDCVHPQRALPIKALEGGSWVSLHAHRNRVQLVRGAARSDVIVQPDSSRVEVVADFVGQNRGVKQWIGSR